MFQFTCPTVLLQPEILRICKIASCRSTSVIVKQTINKSIKDSVVSGVVIKRMKCKRCGYSWRCYPEGIREYSARSKRLVFLGIMLYVSGLSFAKSSCFLTSMLEKDTGTHMTIRRDVQRVAERLRRQKIVIPKVKGAKVVIGLDGTYVKVKGKAQPMLVGILMQSGETIQVTLGNKWKIRELEAFLKAVAKELKIPLKDLKIITDDLEMYKVAKEKQKLSSHQVCLGHVKKNIAKRLKKLKDKIPDAYLDKLGNVLNPPNEEILNQLLRDKKLRNHPKKQCKYRIVYRGIVGDMKRNWKEYTAYLTDPQLPTSNNRTEQAIGRSKVRYKLTRGFGSQAGALNFFTLTQHYGMKHYLQISSVC